MLTARREEERLEHLEFELRRRLARARGLHASIDVPGLGNWIWRSSGRLTVGELARGAGVSRQQLTRAFRHTTGIPPKLYGRLARFHAGLAYAAGALEGQRVPWARVACALGYADQSHMIAEFREFSSLSPNGLLGPVFHPFIEQARDRARIGTRQWRSEQKP